MEEKDGAGAEEDDNAKGKGKQAKKKEKGKGKGKSSKAKVGAAPGCPVCFQPLSLTLGESDVLNSFNAIGDIFCRCEQPDVC